jgi:hypothetical protein
VRSSLTCRQISFLSCVRKSATRPYSGGRGEYYWIYLLDVGVMNVPVP